MAALGYGGPLPIWKHYMFGGHRLHVYLSILFNIFLKYGYVPNEFCRSVIIPLVKNKTGDLTDANNYRAIALSNVVTKILENLLFSFIECGDDVDDYHFGFRKRHSTAACTRVFKDTVDYTIVSMVVMYSVVLLTLQKPLIT